MSIQGVGKESQLPKEWAGGTQGVGKVRRTSRLREVQDVGNLDEFMIEGRLTQTTLQMHEQARTCTNAHTRTLPRAHRVPLSHECIDMRTHGVKTSQ